MKFCKIINYNITCCPRTIDDRIYNFRKLDLKNCRDFNEKINIGRSFNITKDGLRNLPLLKNYDPGINVNVVDQ